MLTKDHKVPKRAGGTDDEKNIQICCWTCNQLKGGLSHEDFLKYRRALKILFELKKIRLNHPERLQIKFMPEHYPDFEYFLPEEQQPIKKKTDNEGEHNGKEKQIISRN